MQIENGLVRRYLAGEDDFSDHWVFSKLTSDGTLRFSRPAPEMRERVADFHQKLIQNFKDFEPFNKKYFDLLFPGWDKLLESTKVVFIVGSPEPYDCFVRENGGESYVFFDLICLLGYQIEDTRLEKLISGLMTHEFAHICIHHDKPTPRAGYQETLAYITFDEGFAHLLGLADYVESYDFSEMIKTHYAEAFSNLKSAWHEKDQHKQQELIISANTGSYWNKFAAIAGKLFLAQHFDELKTIYSAGPDELLRMMALDRL